MGKLRRDILNIIDASLMEMISKSHLKLLTGPLVHLPLDHMSIRTCSSGIAIRIPLLVPL